MDTGLSFLSFLELYRTDVPECRVATRRVVEALDIVEHVGACVVSRSVDLESWLRKTEQPDEGGNCS